MCHAKTNASGYTTSNYTSACDLWSAGAIFAELVTAHGHGLQGKRVVRELFGMVHDEFNHLKAICNLLG